LLKFGLLGYPASYSLSAVMFKAAFKATGLGGSYEIIPTPPADFPATVEKLVIAGYGGVNITTPLKSNAYEIADKRSAEAQKLGAANLLLFNADGSLEAHNTDVVGISTAIHSRDWQINGGQALILGGGGAAKAAIIALVTTGVSAIYAATRKTAAVKEWLRATGYLSKSTEIIPLAWKERYKALAAGKNILLINATTLGWHKEDEFPLDPELAFNLQYVLDLNYPARNRWLHSLKDKVTDCQDGLRVLLYQGTAGFRIFTGVEAPAEEMWEALEEAHR